MSPHTYTYIASITPKTVFKLLHVLPSSFIHALGLQVLIKDRTSNTILEESKFILPEVTGHDPTGLLCKKRCVPKRWVWYKE